MPPEKSAYALARYSRSPDSIRDSIDWVRTHDSQKFLESFYFQYGHASIADLGHTVVCFEGISELAATEIEEEPLWDGQAKSSRYQDFSRSGFIAPQDLANGDAAAFQQAGEALLAAYTQVQQRAFDCLAERLPRPGDMKLDAYRRNIAARAFDVARYLLFWAVPTNVGQVCSIRTLEKQIRRLRASPYAELREVAEEISVACASEPGCVWEACAREPLAPTLARHAEQDRYALESRADLLAWAAQNLPKFTAEEPRRVDLVRPTDPVTEIVATLLYPATQHPFRSLYEMAAGWSSQQRSEVIGLACRKRGKRDEMLAAFRGGLFAFDMLIDLGAYRDMHRHRRCHQFRQAYTGLHGFETPALLKAAGAESVYTKAMASALETMAGLPAPGNQYLMPFGARSRFLFKMDFAEAEYISRVRSGVKGHFSYREIAWEMKQRITEVEPSLGNLIDATPPWVDDPLVR